MLLVETLMHVAGWDAVWYAHPGSVRIAVKDPRWHVGVWAGPDNDLICVWPAATKERAKLMLSPGGRTITSAAVRAFVKVSILYLAGLLR